jgi:hypothetical protein
MYVEKPPSIYLCPLAASKQANHYRSSCDIPLAFSPLCFARQRWKGVMEGRGRGRGDHVIYVHLENSFPFLLRCEGKDQLLRRRYLLFI